MTAVVLLLVSANIRFVDERTDERSEMSDFKPNHTMLTSANRWQAS